MEQLFESPLMRLKFIAYAVGTSLILLVGIAVPLKFLIGQPTMLWFLTPFQIALTCWFTINTFRVAETYNWKFSTTTWKVLISCLIPFGPFIVARQMLNKKAIRQQDGHLPREIIRH